MVTLSLVEKEHAIACQGCAKYAYGCNVSANGCAVIREFYPRYALLRYAISNFSTLHI